MKRGKDAEFEDFKSSLIEIRIFRISYLLAVIAWFLCLVSYIWFDAILVLKIQGTLTVLIVPSALIYHYAMKELRVLFDKHYDRTTKG